MTISFAPTLTSVFASEFFNILFFMSIGFCFGFVLERSGLARARNIAGIFYGYDTRVLKVFFTAAVVAAIGISWLQYVHMINMQSIVWHPLFIWGILVGSLIMGIGFALGGFCPGTGPCAAATGQIDGIFFVIGLLIGILIFSHGYPYWEYFFTHSLGVIHIHDLLLMPKHWFLFIFSIVASLSFWLAEYVQKRVTGVAISSYPRIITSVILILGALCSFFMFA